MADLRSRLPRAQELAAAVDRAATVLVLAAALYLAFRTPVPSDFDLIPAGGITAVLIIVVGLATALALRAVARSRRMAVRVLGRGSLYVLAGLLFAMAFARFSSQVAYHTGPDQWPPMRERVLAARVDSMSPGESAEWGGRIAAHLAGSNPNITAPIAVPADWPYPPDVRLAVSRGTGGEVRVWSRAADGTTYCLALFRERMPEAAARPPWTCGDGAEPPPDSGFAHPVRVVEPVRIAGTAVPGEPWPQYRRDPLRSGSSRRESPRTAGWTAHTDGEVRSSASVVGDIVLVGVHGTGSLEAFDLATGKRRWAARAPNWIHQDVISDGRIAVVGFGDNRRSFEGRAPSGIAAYELRSGQRLWTVFDESSVMTSPVIHDSAIVYATSMGLVKKRSLQSGRLLGETTLTGMVVMGPPAIAGDTVVFSLDQDRVCALLASGLTVLWCRTIPGFWMAGHAGPTVAGGRVIVSGAATVGAATVRELARLPRRLQLKLLRSILFPSSPQFAGQMFVALDLRNGAELWRSALFGRPHGFMGHIAGTATIADSTGVIALPISDTVVAFDPATGRQRWASKGYRSRGAPLIIGDRVLVAGRDGSIEVRSLADGALTCLIRRAVGYDRAGPALAGDLLIFADLRGRVDAVPESVFRECKGGQNPAGGSS